VADLPDAADAALVMEAYSLKSYQVIGLSLDGPRFDIVAILPRGRAVIDFGG
jgi:hypothetical protein